jgi:hypothetical protein
MNSFRLLVVATALAASTAYGSVITYVTPVDSTTSSQAIDAAQRPIHHRCRVRDGHHRGSAGQSTDIAQLVSDLDFVLGGVTGAFTAAVLEQGEDVDIASDGTATTGSTVATGWPGLPEYW